LVAVLTTEPLDRPLDYKAPDGGCQISLQTVQILKNKKAPIGRGSLIRSARLMPQTMSNTRHNTFRRLSR
ncbi:MAG: hypothetical protein ABF271_01840, partial [Abyssibacter sp.]|uniref:hypothetical protein n=1 Tax=Abyssibacter sp. TaxID=2320200 RepID=UPI00321B2DD3